MAMFAPSPNQPFPTYSLRCRGRTCHLLNTIKIVSKDGHKWASEDVKIAKNRVLNDSFNFFSFFIVFLLEISFKRGVICHYLKRLKIGYKMGP